MLQRGGIMSKAVFSNRAFKDHEKVVFFYDKELDFKVIVAIHSTKLGPALGGCRMYSYEDEDVAITDVLRLSYGMTYKNALACGTMGGAKTVVIGNPETLKSAKLFHRLGQFINEFNGQYYTAADLGTTAADMDLVSETTPYVVGALKQSGDPSPATAFGVFKGIQAACKYYLSQNNLEKVSVAVQGLGKVGYDLCKFLNQHKVQLTVCDVNGDILEKAKQEFNAKVVSTEDIYQQNVDIFAPCAMGATINDQTIPRLKAKIVAGSANNQLHHSYHADELHKHNIIYVPDYVINAGGAIYVVECKDKNNKEMLDKAYKKVESIYETLLEIFDHAKVNNLTPTAAANQIAEKRLDL